MDRTGLHLCGIGDEAASSIDDQIRIHADLGLAGIELRTVDGLWAHEWTPRLVKQISRLVREAGLRVPVLDTPLGGWTVTIGSSFKNEREILHRSAESALAVGCRRLRVMSYPNDGRGSADWQQSALWRLRELASMASALGVRLLHENCVGWGSQNAENTIALVRDEPSLGLVFDTGNGLEYGYRGTDYLKAVRQYVQHVHIKDGKRVDGTAIFGLPGDGEADLAGCIRMLSDASYDGWYSLEPHVSFLPHLRITGEAQEREETYRACALHLRHLLDENANL